MAGLNRYRIFVGITAGAAALILLLTQVVGGEDEGELEGPSEEVQLEPISYTPPDPFTEPLTPPTPPADVPPETAVDTPLPPAAQLPVEPASAGGIRSASADTVGLYGGSLNYSRCHRQKLVDFLESSPQKAQAWVDVLNRDPTLYWSGGTRLTTADIRTYVFELTPVLLRSDTWVTNHGYSDGRAYPIQSVLQAGTAVLIDRYGVPRTKCYCGNPLLPPRRFRPVYRGPRWPGFDGRKVIIVTRSVTIIDTFTLYDIATGQLLQRLPGTEGEQDVQSGGEPTVAPSGFTVPPDVELGSGDVQVTLVWDNGADLDLHVTDPQGSEIYFGQPTSPSGGTIDHDDTAGCGTTGSHVENIFWPEGGAPSGTYEVYVVNFSGCDGSASFRLRVTVHGSVVYDDDGLLAQDEPMTPVTFTA